ncbi:MAG: exopolysaccharide biosynthesis polyprenyl glycosylphosphotransferase [Verrucomicrobia bacterium]|nr:exopolysaccharide biosynthesis polyprenyl glycosylphosphotransferase [Verrucomicrobiota bacterium]
MTSPRKTVVALLALDLISLLVAFNVMSILRGVGMDGHFVLLPLSAPFGLLVFAIYLIDGYGTRTNMMSLDYTSLHAIALMSAMIATLLLTYVILPAGYELQSSRGVIALSYLALIPLTLGYRRFIYRRLSNARGERNLVFLGDRQSCAAFRDECAKVGATQRIIFSIVNETSIAPFTAPGAPEIVPFSTVLDDIQRGRVEVEALILRESSRELEPGLAQRLVKLYFDGLPTYTLELFQQVYWRKIPIYRLNQTWLFQEGFQMAREPVFERVKRVADVFLGSIGLLLGAPLILLGGLAIWLGDRGSPFFAQTRIGKNHVPFRIYKLRTMRPSAAGENRYTQAGDTRITTVGKFLRNTRIDELPQVWNVLRGDMSLIGPRAEWDQLVEDYERKIPCYYFRHLVKPGITGWAQVNYPYGANLDDTIRKLEYDLYYIRHFSFTLDASIVLKTIHIMLFGKGR